MIDKLMFEVPSLEDGTRLMWNAFPALPPVILAKAYVDKDIAIAWQTIYNRIAGKYAISWDDSYEPIKWMVYDPRIVVWMHSEDYGAEFHVEFLETDNLTTFSQVLADVSRAGYKHRIIYKHGDVKVYDKAKVYGPSMVEKPANHMEI